MKTLFKLAPHDCLTVHMAEKSQDGVGSSLFAIRSKGDGNKEEVWLTGEEMTDLAKRWLEYAKGAGMSNDKLTP